TILGYVLGVEAPRHGKIHLDGAQLPYPPDGILEGKLDLGAIKGTLARQQLPGQPLAVESIGQGFLGLVPDLVGTHPLFGAGGKSVDHLIETEVGIDFMEEVDETRHLRLDLRLGAENVGVAL